IKECGVMSEIKLEENIDILPRGKYLQIAVEIEALDNLIIRSTSSEEVLTFHYEKLGNRFIIPWRKIKGRLRRYVMEKQRSLGIFEECHLKDGLCLQCPSCFMFGATGETNKNADPEYKSNVNNSYNLASRILGETFISVRTVKEILDYTANAVDEKTFTTGQALMTKIFVPAGEKFRGVITLRDPTPEMVSIIIDNLQRMARLGAETRDWGKVKTTILGFIYSDREEISSMDLLESMPKRLESDVSKLKLPPVDKAYKKLAVSVQKMLKDEGLIKKQLYSE
ncbi:MAG: type I-D CRISPR-associated protein Cas7/Csc2, partial [Candidatus Latescibacterota bacterium]